MSADSQKRRYVPCNSCKSGDVGPLAYRNKLVRPGQAAEPCSVFDYTVTSYLNKIAHYNLVSKYAVVSNVSADHNEIIITNCGLCPRVNTRMDCYLLVDYVSVAYNEPSDFGV